MKSSYTKRALAFWLAVAMVATSAPMAFAMASTSPTSMTPSGTTVTAATITNLQLSESTVEVNGQNEKQVTATVTLSADATVQWSATEGVTVTENLAATTEGSITKTATVKIPAAAAEGKYTITATVGSESKTVELNVTRATPVMNEIQKVYADNNVDVTVKEQATAETTVTIEGLKDKVYDGKPIENPKVKVGDADVADGITYEYRELAKNGGDSLNTPPTDVGKYQLTVWYDKEGKHGSATQIFEITPRELTVTGLKATSREYKLGNTSVELTNGSLQNVVDSDSGNVSIDRVTGTMADDNAGENKPVTVAVTLEGSKAGNYTVKVPTDVKVNITKAKYTADGVSNNALSIEVNANKGNTVYGAIPNAMAQLKTAYAVQSATDANSILKDTPVMSGDSIKVAVKDTAAVGQSASIPVKVSFQNYEDVTITYTIKVVNKKDVSNSITFNSKTVTANGQAQSLEPAKIKGYTGGTWTYAVVNSKTNTLSNAMPTFTQPGTYTVRATWEDDIHIGSGEATLTIKPVVKSTITVSASQLGSSYDDNYKYWDLDERGSGDGYLNLRADADDYLVNQKKDGTSSEWIGMTISPEVSGTAKASGLWVSTDQSTWYELKKNDTLSLSDFYISDIGEKTFDLWYDTDDRDCHDSLYLATDKNGSNKFELYVDFNSYSGSSSSSSGSSSSNTSKKDGDRVSTTTVDKTPSVKNGSATVTFSSSALSDALDDNKKEAKREKADKTYIELDVKNSKSVDDTTITVPRSSLDKLADEDTGLKLTTNQGTVTFDYRALAEIYDACDKTNIEFYLEEEDDDQYVLLIKDGSSDVIDLGRGSVEVTFDYKLKSGEKSSDVKVYRIGNGDKTWLSTYGGSTVYGAADVYAAAPTYVTDMKADYSSSKKKVTFTTDALGTFLITTDTLKTGSGSTTTTPTYNAFVDVPSSRWSATYINKLASLGIINGTGGGYFEPTLYVTREEFVKMLAGVAGANVTGYTSSRFPDVPLSRWSAPYIAWAADRGITTGTDGGNFAPAMRITREEMATMIYRYVQSAGETLPAKNTPVIFADANLISGWAQTPVSVMQQAGIIDGNVTNGRYTFDPKVSASREECAKMLAVLYDLVR